MEGEPEENGDAEDGEKGVQTLLDLLGHGLLLLGRVGDAFGRCLLGGIREYLLVDQEDDKGDHHGQRRGDVREVDALVEDFQVGGGIEGGTGQGDFVRDVRVLAGQVAEISVDGLVAELGKVGVIQEAVHLEPPLADQRGDERSDEATDVDKHVEDLEAGVALVLGDSEGFGTLLGLFGLEVVVHLSHDGLQVALEQAVAEGDHRQGEACEGQEPARIGGRGGDGNGQEDVSRRHDHETLLDGALVVLGPVSDDAAHQGEDIDGGVEDGIDQTGRCVADAELGGEEQGKDRIHDVVAEAWRRGTGQGPHS